jgi:hypothetical protein
VTYNKLKARRVPLGCGDLAADIAAALNELPRHNGDTWIAMQHVFS